MKLRSQTISVSSSEGEDQVLFVPTSNMISQYNRQYSMVVRQIERFLKETTECIQRFVTFHNFGVNLNLTQLLGNVVNIETNFRTRLSHTQKQPEKDPKQHAKQKYETSFNKLIQRMADLFNDLIDCEVEFKKNYFGVHKQEYSRQSQERARSARNHAFSVSSMTKSSASKGKLNLQDYLQQEEKQEHRQAELRATLNQKLKPTTAVSQTQCMEEYSTTENLYRLNQKIDCFISDIKASRARQEKVIQLFNLSRVKKLHSPLEATQCFTPNISMIAPQAEEIETEQEIDSILQNWRHIRKSSDCYTEKGQNRRFFKKRGNTTREQS